MKNFTILTIAPALTLLVISCSGPANMQSGEYDDMYYSTSDKTEYVQPAIDRVYAQAEEAEQQDEAASAEPGVILNPEYADNTEDITSNYYGNDDYEYYDGREYDPRNNWYRPNHSFVDPSWAYEPYPSYSGYSYHDSYYRHRYADPFYDPFYYDPFAYRPYWGSGVTIAISFNYGWGNYYNRYYPYYGYGYGYGYTPWYGHCNNYYGYNYVYDYPRYATPYKVQYGPRGERGGVATRGAARDEQGRGNLTETEGSEQRIVQPGRPGRTERGGNIGRNGTPITEDRKEVIPASPGRESYSPRSGSEARPARERIDRPREEQQQQREQPATRTRPATETRSSRDSTPRREYRSSETRQSTAPRETNRSYEQRETRSSEPAPSRSSGSSSGSSGGGERSGRPPRGN